MEFDLKSIDDERIHEIKKHCLSLVEKLDKIYRLKHHRDQADQMSEPDMKVALTIRDYLREESALIHELVEDLNIL